MPTATETDYIYQTEYATVETTAWQTETEYQTETDVRTETNYHTDFQTATETNTYTQSASTVIRSVTIERTSVFTTTNSAGKVTEITTTWASIAAETSVAASLAGNTTPQEVKNSTPIAAIVGAVVGGCAILAAVLALLFIGSRQGWFEKKVPVEGIGSDQPVHQDMVAPMAATTPYPGAKGPDHSYTPVPGRDEVGDSPAPMYESHVTSPAQSPMVQSSEGGGMGPRWFSGVRGEAVHEVHRGEGTRGGHYGEME